MRKKDVFFERMEALGLALTYDDVRLRSSYSETMPHEVNLHSRFSRNVPVKIPMISAAMDTVTEHRLATALAKLGGLGVVHRNLLPEVQANEVARVKSHLNACIESPTCVFEDETLEEVLIRKEEEELSFDSFPVLSREGRLVGLLSKTDFDFCESLSQTVGEVMTSELLTATPGIALEEAYNLMRSNKKKLLPLLDEAGKIKGLYVYSDVKRIVSGSFEQYNLDERGQLRVAAAVGAGGDVMKRAALLVAANVDALVIDTAHGDSVGVFNTLKALKQAHPDTDIVVGNISEPDSAERLLKAGADGLKIGQGPGSICTTRIIAGIGSPQVSAVYKCSQETEKYDVPLCADGGLRYSGDITIAIGAGASTVMMGSMLAGTTESPGMEVYLNGRRWKRYRGMGSLAAMTSSSSSRERYRQVGTVQDKLVPEGVEGLVPFKGALEDVLFQYIGGLRAGMGYVGAANVKELQEKANFLRISPAGAAESHAHDIQITKESPNYSGFPK